jgi:hypothetical protein
MEVSAKSIQHLVEFNLLYRNMYVFFREKAPGSEWRMGEHGAMGATLNLTSQLQVGSYATTSKAHYPSTPSLPPELASQHNNFPKSVLKQLSDSSYIGINNTKDI